MVWSSVTCSQTQDTDRLESNRRVYCIDVNEQRKQGSNGRYRVFNLNGDDTDEDILLPGFERSWDDGVIFQELVSGTGCR